MKSVLHRLALVRVLLAIAVAAVSVQCASRCVTVACEPSKPVPPCHKQKNTEEKSCQARVVLAAAEVETSAVFLDLADYAPEFVVGPTVPQLVSGEDPNWYDGLAPPGLRSQSISVLRI